jgi:ParB/RepB/Spo0J family partition protein
MSQRPKASDATWRDLIPRGQEPAPLKGARLLPVAAIQPNPRQARQVFDETALEELARSIRVHGVLEPVLVRPLDAEGTYELVAGERRVRAARRAGLEVVPAIIRPYTDEQAAYITAVENLQRADLDIEDEARQFAALLTLTGLSQRKLAEQLGITHTYLSKRVRLLERPDVLTAVRTGQVGFEEAMRLISADAPLPAPAVYRDDTRDEPIVDPTERAALDAHPTTPDPAPPAAPYLGANPQAAPLQRTPWRDRPIIQFMDWAARVDTENLAAKERAAALRQLAEARAWLNRLEERLAEGATDT